MTVTLKIDNCDALPDGGPLEYSSNKRGFDLGRETHLDWTLPDDSRYISGRHCEVRYEKNHYWLYDISRNGTFLNGSQDRIKSPYQLQDGDRLAIGHYIVTVFVQDVGGSDFVEEEFGAAEQNYASASDDIWAIDGSVPDPIDRRDLMPPKEYGQRAPDFSEQYLEIPEMRSDPKFDAAGNVQPAPRGVENVFASSSEDNPFGVSQPPLEPFQNLSPSPAEEPPQFSPPSAPMPAPVDIATANQNPPVQSVAAQQAIPPVAVPQSADTSELLRYIAEGAGVSADCFSQSDPAETGREIGAVLRVVIEQMAQLLKARAAAKTMAKSSNRTMISAMDNNPLKFVPTTEEMFDVMFGRRKAGYLGAQASLEHGFSDLKTHEYATYAAMQKALARLLEDFSPESVEDKLHNSAFSSKGAKAWETYVARWEAMSEQHENGVLDLFLNHFADAYDKASRSKKNQ